jgi:FkbM family methyltransferase
MRSNGELRALQAALESFTGDVFDVGANAGQWAEEVIPYLGNKRLHSFEPIPMTYSELIRNIGGSDGIIFNSFGLSSADAEIMLNFSPKATTISSAYDLIFDDNDQTQIACAFRTGDGYVAEYQIDQISLLKIDVEGMEMEVLKGFSESFGRRAISSVQFEHGPSHILSRHFLKDFVDFFELYDFDVFLIFPKSLVRIDYKLRDENFGGQNLLAVRRDLKLVL